MVARYATAAKHADINPNPHMPHDTRGSKPFTITMPVSANPKNSHCHLCTRSFKKNNASNTVNTGLKY